MNEYIKFPYNLLSHYEDLNESIRFYNEFNEENYLKLYSFAIVYHKNTSLSDLLIREFLENIDADLITRYQTYVSKKFFIPALVYHATLDFIPDPNDHLNETRFSKIKLYLNFLLKKILHKFLVKRIFVTRISLESKIAKIYNDILDFFGLKFNDYFIDLRSIWIDSFFAEYDPDYKIRYLLSDYAIDSNVFEKFEQRNEAILSTRELDSKECILRPEICKKLQSTCEIPCEKKFEEYFEPLDHVSSITPILYATDPIEFEDEDTFPYVRYSSTEKLYFELIDKESFYEATLNDLAKPLNSLTHFCDCGNLKCPGCYERCIRCREKKCFLICRKKAFYDHQDLFRQSNSLDQKHIDRVMTTNGNKKKNKQFNQTPMTLNQQEEIDEDNELKL